MSEDEALAELLRLLKARNYRFTAPAPETHRVVLARPLDRPADLRDIFGWTRPFARDEADPAILDLMAAAGVLETRGDQAFSAVRVASLGEDLFLHSAFPPEDENAVFFGPDTYRYAALLRAELDSGATGRIVDIGAGAGAGGLVAARLRPGARIVLADVNPKALRLARLNAAAAGLDVELVESDGLSGVRGAIDIAIANPPYIGGAGEKTYSDGGEMLGAALALAWAKAAAERLSPGGRLILYSGSAIVEGEDPFRRALARAMAERGCTLRYREIDPDVFGGTLVRRDYGRVDRIAAIGAVAVKDR